MGYRITFIVSALLLSVLTPSYSAQRSKKRTPPKKPAVAATSAAEPVPAEYEYRCIVDAGLKIACSVVTVGSDKFIEPHHVSNVMTSVFTRGTDRVFVEFEAPRVVIDADPSLSMIAFIDVVNSFRVDSRQVIELMLSDDVYLRLSPKPDRKNERPEYPDPVKLQVDLTSTGQIKLNSESAGEIGKLEPLTKRLAEIFKVREDTGVFRPGKNEIEKSVSIIMPLERFSRKELEKIAAAIRMAGGDRLILDIDAYYYPKEPPLTLEIPSIPERKPVVPINR